MVEEVLAEVSQARHSEFQPHPSVPRSSGQICGMFCGKLFLRKTDDGSTSVDFSPRRRPCHACHSSRTDGCD